jgi:NAD(P)H-flavin reductase
VETTDTVTLGLATDGDPLPSFAPGQFAMLTAFGVGEVPISVSDRATAGAGRLGHTLRAVGPVTRALHAMQPGCPVGVRGPFGTGWDLARATGRDLLVVAGGIGLAPLRPVLLHALARPTDFGRTILLIGTRTPDDLVFQGDLETWRRAGVETAVTVDRPDDRWRGHVGVVTTLFPVAGIDPARSVAFICGPEVMMRFAADALVDLGMPANRIQVSLERTMRCGAGWCGHCQLGPLLLCRDGPVVDYDQVQALLRVREL